jgi:hypothetical protein
MAGKLPCRMRKLHGCDPCKICGQEEHVFYGEFNFCDLCGMPRPVYEESPYVGKRPSPGGIKYADLSR